MLCTFAKNMLYTKNNHFYITIPPYWLISFDSTVCMCLCPLKWHYKCHALGRKTSTCAPKDTHFKQGIMHKSSYLLSCFIACLLWYKAFGLLFIFTCIRTGHAHLCNKERCISSMSTGQNTRKSGSKALHKVCGEQVSPVFNPEKKFTYPLCMY